MAQWMRTFSQSNVANPKKSSFQLIKNGKFDLCAHFIYPCYGQISVIENENLGDTRYKVGVFLHIFC